MSSSRVEPSEDVIYQAMQKEIVLLNIRSQQYFGLDDVGSEMWKLMVQHGDVETVVKMMSAEYDTGPDTIRRDLEDLIKRLKDVGLLNVVEVPE